MLQAKKLWNVYRRSDKVARERAFGALVALSITKRLKRFMLPLNNLNYEQMFFRRHLLKDLLENDHILQKLKGVCVSSESNFAEDINARECDRSLYRTIDGTCNNVKNALWGSTYSPLQRAVPPDYADGLNL